MDKNLAEKTLSVVYQANFVLDSYLQHLKTELPEDEFKAYCHKFGKIMAETLIEVMNPLYEEHPELKPEKLGGTYKTNDNHYKKIHALIMQQANESKS